MVRLPGTLLGGLLAARLLDEAFGFLPEGAIEQLRRDSGVGYAAMTVVFAAPYAGSLPALWSTARSDRTGRRAIVLVGGVLMAASLAGFAAATSATAAVAASALWGFGGSLLVHGAELELAAVPSGAPAGELHRRLRASNLWGTVGDVAGPVLLAGVLGAGWSWRVAFRSVLVAVGLVLAVAGSVVAGVPVWLAVTAGLVVNAGTAAAWLTVQHAALTLRPGAEGRVLSLVNAIEHTTVVLPVGLGLLADRYGLAAAFARTWSWGWPWPWSATPPAGHRDARTPARPRTVMPGPGAPAAPACGATRT